MRILVTGSRAWKDEPAVRAALSPWVHKDNVLVHGAAIGLDTMAERLWMEISAERGFVGKWERHFAKDHESPLARNTYMCDLGADVCFAFAEKWASGTGNCARTARRVGIVVYDYGVRTS